MNWRSADTLPGHGDKIVAITPHWKQVWPTSLEIVGYEVEIVMDEDSFAAVLSNLDDHGRGSYAPPWEEVSAWMPAEEFLAFMPSWINWKDDFGGRDE